MYIHICSSQSDHIYSSNKPWAFTAQLPQQLPPGPYECALTEVRVTREASLEGFFLISTDLVSQGLWYNSLQSGLRTFMLNARPGSGESSDVISFIRPYYFKVGKGQAREISFQITSGFGDSRRLHHQHLHKLWLTLHLRPRSC